MIIDTHIHTIFSSDSNMNIEEAINKAEALNIGFTVTDHIDIGYPVSGKYFFNTQEYFAAYEKYRSEKILLGVELGMRTEFIEESRNAINRCPFDYIIGSLHVIDDIDLSWSAFYSGHSKKKVITTYLTALSKCVKYFDFIDSLGHIDYICRHLKDNDKELHYEDFSDYIDSILITLKNSDKALEINTRRCWQPETLAALTKIYKRWEELGGRVVTIGSDAHNVDSIGLQYQQGLALAASCGLRPVYFKNHQINYIK